MKRFTETAKWDDPWFIRLPANAKVLWQYICDRCDCSGVIDFCPELASVQIGAAVTEDSLLAFGERVQKLPSGKWQIVKFLTFQYGVVDARCPAHKPVIKAIQINGLKFKIRNLTNRVSGRVYHTLQEKDKDKDKSTEKGSGEKMFDLELQKLNDSVRSLFEEWIVVRKGMGNKPKDWGRMFSAQIKWLREFPEKIQAEIVSQSTRNGWRGLFEPKQSGNGAHHPERQMSSFEIEKRIMACNDKINELWRAAGNKTTPEIQAIKKRKDELKVMLTQ